MSIKTIVHRQIQTMAGCQKGTTLIEPSQQRTKGFMAQKVTNISSFGDINFPDFSFSLSLSWS